MFGLGPMELLIVFLVILLVFGAKRIPEIAQGLGKGITEFKKAAREVTNELDATKTTQNYPPPPPVQNDLRSGQQVANSPQQAPPQQQQQAQTPPPQQNQQS